MPDTRRRQSLAVAWAVARTEYIRWATDPRMILLPVLLVFLYQSAIDPLLQMAAQMQAPLHWLEPFVAVTNSPLLMLFLPLVFLMLLGDFPRTDGCALFVLYRVGRVRWLQGQLLFVLLAVLSFLVCIAAGVTLPALGRLQGGANWSETVRLYTRAFPEQAQSFAAELIPEQLYNQMRPAAALLHTCLLQLLYLLILALWMLRFWCARRRRLGFFTAVLLVALGAASAMLGGGWMWAFPLAHANVWLRHSAVLRQVAFPLWGSYLALAALAAALAVLDLRAARRYNFLDTAEVE